MTCYGYDGRVVHHNNCTYCRHRQQLPAAGYTPSRPRWMERCKLTGRSIPRPYHGKEDGPRLCEHYQQTGCDCPQCGTLMNQMVDK